jgi:hypothetical protein
VLRKLLLYPVVKVITPALAHTLAQATVLAGAIQGSGPVLIFLGPAHQ